MLAALFSALFVATVPDRVTATFFGHSPTVCSPGDEKYNPEHDLSGNLTGGGTGVITNHSKDCHYEVGLAVYEKFDEVIDNQEIFDFAEGVVKAKDDITLHVDVPDCAYQIDLFYGDVLQSLDGQRYGERLLKADHRNGDHYCEVVLPPVCDAFAADPTEIDRGQSSTLSWETTNATEVTISGVGAVDPDGTTSVSPSESTTYTLTAENSEGATDTCTAHVTVSEKDPEPPVCPYTEADGYVIDFGGTDRLRSDQGAAESVTNRQSIDLVPGTYAVSLVAWDGYIGRENANQPREQYELVLSDGDGEIVMSPASGDLADNVREATFAAEVADTLVIDRAPTQAFARHAAYPDASSPNSLNPICAVLERKVAPEPSCDFFAADPGNIQVGESTTLTWETTNAEDVTIAGIGTVDPDGTTSVTPNTTTTYTLTATNRDGVSVSCEAPVTVTEVPAPSCDAFSADPATVTEGGTVTLNWQTTNATEVRLNEAIGEVPADGSTTVSNLSTSTTFVLTVFGTDDQQVTCEAPVTVTELPAPSCDAFSADPSAIDVGESTTLSWETTNAVNVSIAGIGDVDPDGSTSVSPSESTTYTLTAENATGDTVSCEVPVAVADPAPFTCETAVDFDASPRTIDEGDSTTLTWSTTDVDSLTIGNTNFTALSGSESVSPRRDTTYTLRATRGDDTISCPLTVRVDEDDDNGGGGGGGSNSPICELDASLTRIDRGDEVTLTWETSRATEVIIENDDGDTIITTEDLMLKDKRDLFDGSTTVSPTETTTYTLLATRGSRDADCEVRVRVSGDEPEEESEIVVLESRDQEPLVAGISLTEVPYTGFEAGPILTFLFYLALVAWSAFLAYFFINRQEPGTGPQLAAATGPQTPTPRTERVTEPVRDAEAATGVSVSASSVVAPARTESAPTNLPTGTPVIGYANYADTDAGTAVDSAAVATASDSSLETDVAALEAHAHTRSALVSSDALRHLMTSTSGDTDHTTLLDTVISAAKASYPAEDGWTVINATRMRELCEQCTAPAQSTQAPHAPAVVPQGAGSLAEALASGHVAAAYALIDQRPMFALADAASEFDEIVRARREGRTPNVSELLATEVTKLSDAQLQNIIDALTSALDGTYTDEAAAVKMAIMKAAKQVA